MSKITSVIKSSGALVSSLIEQFQKWSKQYRDDPLRQDAFQRAARCRHVLSRFEAVRDSSVVPTDFILREFIHGSIYQD